MKKSSKDQTQVRLKNFWSRKTKKRLRFQTLCVSLLIGLGILKVLDTQKEPSSHKTTKSVSPTQVRLTKSLEMKY